MRNRLTLPFGVLLLFAAGFILSRGRGNRDLLHAAPGPSAADARGKRVALPAPPRRIVSLSPGTTEMLFALGLKGRIVADTSFCNYPPEALPLPKIGDVNTSVEKVLAQRPDLVVGSVTANRRAIEPLERLGQKVFAVDPKTLDESYSALRSLGQVTGQGKQAEDVVKAMRVKADSVTAAVARSPRRPKVLMVVQMDPLIVVGPGNFMDSLVTLAGAENVGRVTGKDWGPLAPERVLALKPDVIFAGRSDSERIRSKPGWGAVPAVKANALYALPGDEGVRPGPRLVLALERLARLLHPEAFPAKR